MRLVSLQPFARTNHHLKLSVAISREEGGLDIRFELLGRRAADLADLHLPPLREPNDRVRRDELWKSTCLELFIGSSTGRDYIEVNLSPTGDWNVYSFTSYREGMRPTHNARHLDFSTSSSPALDAKTWRARIGFEPDQSPAPKSSTDGSTEFSTKAESDLASLLGASHHVGLVIGAAAVLEYKDGTREYWALTHAGDKPDFHLRESFRLVL